MNAKIESWLSRGRNYTEGLSLYLRYGESEFLKNLFSKGESTYNRARLHKELVQLLETQTDVPEQKKISGPITDQEYSSLPDEGKLIQKQWKEWYSEMNALRHQLPNPITEKERHKMALKILELDKKVRAAWEKLDYWRKYGELPGALQAFQDLQQLTPVELVRRKNTLLTYLSKFKNDASKEAKMTLWKTELLHIVKLLDAPFPV